MESQSLMLRDLPHEERPRERMTQYGAEALSHAELLAILLRVGTKRESAIQLAQRILNQAGGLRRLGELGMADLTEIKGIGPAKAIQLKAAIELGKRMAVARLDEPVVIRSPRDAAELLTEQLRYLQKEHFVCLFLNTKNHVISRETLSMGSLNASIVHPREVFRAANKCGSASIICAHNHPSGDPAPSPEDIALTRRLTEAGELIGIDVLDHLIIGDNGFISLKEKGLL